MFLGSQSKVQDKIKTIDELEKAGYIDAAAYLATKLVKENPSCQECRFYMGRLVNQVNVNKAEQASRYSPAPK